MDDVTPIVGKLEPIPLKDLNIRFIPMAKLGRWYDDMSLANSPHVDLLRQYIEHGLNWDILENGRYAQERRARRFEFKQEKWSEKWIKKHIKIRIKIYESLKKTGFVSQGKPVMVLKEPFWKTRYDYPGIEGYEIWNGAGRCAAAHVLGWKTIPGLWVQDTRPGYKKCEKIEKKFPK